MEKRSKFVAGCAGIISLPGKTASHRSKCVNDSLNYFNIFRLKLIDFDVVDGRNQVCRRVSVLCACCASSSRCSARDHLQPIPKICIRVSWQLTTAVPLGCLLTLIWWLRPTCLPAAAVAIMAAITILLWISSCKWSNWASPDPNLWR